MFIHDTNAEVIKSIKIPGADCNNSLLFSRFGELFLVRIDSNIITYKIQQFEIVGQKVISLPQLSAPLPEWKIGLCPDSFDAFLCVPKTNMRFLVNLKDSKVSKYIPNSHPYGSSSVEKIIFPRRSVVFLLSTEGHILCEIIGNPVPSCNFERMVKQELNSSFSTLKNHMDQFYQNCNF